jgi:Flp pilus assembly protein TadD
MRVATTISIPSRFPSLSRRFGFVLLALLLLASACAASGAPGAAPVAPGETLTGNYLSARHALNRRDAAASADFLRAALQAAPEDPVLLNRTMTTLILDGRVAEAVPLAERYRDLGHDNALVRLTVIVEAIEGERFGDALAILDDLPPDDGLNYLSPLLKAWALIGLGRTDDALAALQPLSSGGGPDTLHHLHAAWINEMAGRTAVAVEHLGAVTRTHEAPWLRLADLGAGVLARSGDTEAALALYRAYLERHPGSRLVEPSMDGLAQGSAPAAAISSAEAGAAEALFDGAGIAGRQNNRETALFLGQLGLYLRPDFPALQVVVADLLEGFGRLDDANAIYAAVERGSPLARSATISTARNLERMDRLEEAEALLRSIALRHPDEHEPLSELGDLLRKRDRFAEAVEAYDAAFARIEELKPFHWRLLYARGIALERARDWPRAEADFLKALEFEPEQPFVLNYLGYSWVEQGTNLAEAERMIRKAVELRPNDGYIVDSLGWVLYRLGRFDEAVSALEQAIELRPQDPVINDHLGDAYWTVGREREARFQWRAALELEPEDDLRAEIEGKLRHGLIREASAAQQP